MWHNVKQELPEIQQFVILCTTTNTGFFQDKFLKTYYLGWLDENEDGTTYWWADMGKELRNVTHWHELPEQPFNPQ